MSSDIAASNTAAELDNALALTPEKTLSLWTTYELPRNITLGGGVQYMDSVFRNATNTAAVPSYWLLNTVVSYAVNQNLTLAGERQQPGRRGIRRPRRRRPLHPGRRADGIRHARRQLLTSDY